MSLVALLLIRLITPALFYHRYVNVVAVVLLFLPLRRDTDYQDSTLCVATEVESSAQQPSLSLQITLQHLGVSR